LFKQLDHPYSTGKWTIPSRICLYGGGETVESEISVEHVQVKFQPDALPITEWLAREIERWVFKVQNLEVDAEIPMNQDVR
jgi:hypothetical protein